MSEFGERLLIENSREGRTSRYRAWILLAVPLAAILFQVYIPLFFQFLAYLELPLLVTVYFSVMRRSPIGGIFIGAGIGLVQDSLSHQPLGMFGLVKTLAGYFAASVGMRFDMDHYALRFVLGFFFLLFHQVFYWVLRRALLGQMVELDLQQTLLVGLLNAAVTLPLFHVLDKLKATG